MISGILENRVIERQEDTTHGTRALGGTWHWVVASRQTL